MKYVNCQIVFREIPDEITLAINISNCPFKCLECHSSYLRDDIGTEITEETLKDLISSHKGITCISFMGGDRDPSEVNTLAKWLKEHTKLKVAWYSGRDVISGDISIINFDYIKIGHYDKDCGPLNVPTTNQILYKVEDGKLENITYKFWKQDETFSQVYL
nr:MAG TPA: anaerobic ribonucleoside-triphosphate reductase activating protein [Caudoviricetes sp.]